MDHRPIVTVTRKLPDRVETSLAERFDARLNGSDQPMSGAALRKAFWAAVNSDELKADANRLKIIIDPLNWQDTVSEFKKIFATPPEVIARVKQIVGAK